MADPGEVGRGPFSGRPAVAQAAVLLALLAVPGPAASQPEAGVSPPPGLAVPDDTIWPLAADPADYPEQEAIYLLAEGALRWEADGTGRLTYRYVLQALGDEAVEGLAERRIVYDAGRQDFTLHWARVVDSEGRVVSAEPIHVQEGDEPVPTQSPVYTSRKRVSISLGGLAPGHSVDYSYTIHQREPPMPGDFWWRRSVNGRSTVRRARFVADLPADPAPRVVEENLLEPAEITRADGRVIREWRFGELERIRPEPFAADSNGVIRSITVAPPLEWADVAASYTALTADRYEVPSELEPRLAEVVRGSGSLADSLRAVHRWVAQDIRYVSISLGRGGYQPRPPVEVMRTASGDCKDKATLFIALARRMGVTAHPVLVRTSGTVRPDLPSVLQFNHMIAVVETDDGARTYLDLTVPVVPYGEVHPGLQGRTGVLLRDDGSAETVVFPKTGASVNRSVVEVTGTLDEGGDFEGRYVQEVAGAVQYRLRDEFSGRMTDRRLESVARTLANRVFDGARGDSLQVFDGRDLEAIPRIVARVTAEDVLRPGGGGRHILPLELPRYGSRAVIDRLRQERRRFPIDAHEVFGLREQLTLFRITLPGGWRAELPESVRAESAFGFYETTYEQDGRDLVVRRVVRGNDEVLRPEATDELIAWFTAMVEDDVEYVVLVPGAR